MFKSLLLKGRVLCLLLCCMVSSLVVTAQTKHTGKVIGNDDKLPVVGASVRVKGTNTGAVTDVNGDFTLALSPGNVIVVSYIGYQSQEVTVTGTAFITISLQPASSSLNEVVVTGYTTQVKKDISGSVAVVDVNDAKKINASSSEQLLQGQAAGVTVLNSGAPGAQSTVFIRGVSGFGNTTPLYIIDGTQVGDMSQVNPQDIESISVLKDAGTAAIYGISGGNGVVIVTTKKGKAGKSTISYSGFYGSQVPPGGNVWHLINPTQESILTYRAGDVNDEKIYGGSGVLETYGYQGVNGGSFGSAGVTNDPTVVNLYHFDANNPGNDFLVQKFNQAGTDWFHTVFKAAPTQQHTITGSGGTDKSTYLFSLNYVNQQGTLLNDYEKRYAARVNTTTSALNNHIRFGESGFVTYEENNGGYNGTQQNEGGAIAYTYREMPIIPVYDVSGIQFGGGYDGPTGEPLGNGSNPYQLQVEQATNNAHYVRVEGNIFAEADIAKYFTVRTSIGGLLYNQYYWNIGYNPYSNFETHTNANGNSENEQMSTNYNWTNTIRYKESFGKHNIEALGGFEVKDNHGREFHAYNSGLFSLDPNYVELGQGVPSTPPASTIYQPIGIESFFAKVDYNYDNKYILSGTVRRDATSIFAPGHQVGVFPSGTVAWRVSQEDFMKGVSWVNDLKLRGSYGEAGSYGDISGTNAYSTYASGFGSSYYGITGGTPIQQGFYNNQIGNPNVTWETYKLTNIGLDATLFNHLDLTVEWYNKTVIGFLFPISLPATTGGANAPFVNAGDVKNTGVDISATYRDRISSDFSFSIGANITTYKNDIVKESTASQFFDTSPTHDGTNIVRNEVGHPISSFYGYQVVGIYQNASQVSALPGYNGAVAGSFIYKDVDGDGKITSADKTFIGNPNPNFTYGVNLNANYKHFDFTMVLYGSQGNKDYNYTKYWTDFYYTFTGGKSQALFNNSAIVANGVVTNPSATVPAATLQQSLGSNAISSYYVENGSFLKCRVAQIGYTFDPGMLKKIGFDKLHVYVQGTNLFTITKYDGLDPEMQPSLNLQQGAHASSAYGVDYGAYPNNQRQYIFGVDLTF
jgi:TonB-linked SusC/RagA family outer membrane protein